MFSAILDRGDVKGIFCGHDHINTYHGNYYGVLLGYEEVQDLVLMAFQAQKRTNFVGPEYSI